MTKLEWLFPQYLWILLIVPLLALAWIYAQWRYRTRIQAFGDDKLLDIKRRWPAQLLGFCLRILGIAASVLLLADPGTHALRDFREDLDTRIILDTQSLAATSNDTDGVAEELERCLYSILPDVSPSRISLYKSGNPVSLLIPPTWDTQGFLTLCENLPEVVDKPEVADLSSTLNEVMAQTKTLNPRLVVISNRPSEEIAQLLGNLPFGSPRLHFIRTSTGDSDRYGLRNSDGKWTWGDNHQFFVDSLKESDRSWPSSVSWPYRLSIMQWIALLGFLALSGESLWQLLIR